ncbi:hypothetical protein [Nocardia cerradoensis]|uniref:Secreted protein n=1 Tax=Nocardia cerradoensis TaxID=85688 RepID=A0A231H9Q7_9NOCA|nr:hypothetical protein [Nocardia cerradoensis]NKY42666.1 hypothetical protein [Nocardia cerradoensis]OXR45684.1 hypothetical protein B7C42_01976 [Nocardia cerradoensis]
MVLYLMLVLVATVATAALTAHGTLDGTRRPGRAVPERRAAARERLSAPARTRVAGGDLVRVRSCRSLGGSPVARRS